MTIRQRDKTPDVGSGARAADARELCGGRAANERAISRIKRGAPGEETILIQLLSRKCHIFSNGDGILKFILCLLVFTRILFPVEMVFGTIT